MAQYKGSTTKRGFNPQTVSSKVGAINDQTNRTMSAMREVRSLYSEQRADYSRQVQADQNLQLQQLDQNAKAEIGNAQNKRRQVQADGVAAEQNLRQKVREEIQVFNSLAGFAEAAGATADKLALKEKKRQETQTTWDAKKGFVPEEVVAKVRLTEESASNAQSDRITAYTGRIQSAEATGEVTPLYSSDTQRNLSQMSPDVRRARLGAMNLNTVIANKINDEIELSGGRRVILGQALNDPALVQEATRAALTQQIFSINGGPVSGTDMEQSGLLKKYEDTVKSFSDRAADQAIARNTGIIKNNVESLLMAPTLAEPGSELRQREINSRLQTAIQQIGFPATMEKFSKRYLDPDGNLIGPTAEELYQATVQSGVAPMSPIQLAKLRAAETSAIKSHQQNTADTKSKDGERLWMEIQATPEYDALDINNPDSMESAEWVASVREVYKEKDIPMPAELRRFISDMESGAKEDEVRRATVLENNPNSVEEDTYKEFEDPRIRKKVYDIWFNKTGGGYGDNWKEITKEMVEFSKDAAGVKFQPGGQNRTGNAQSRAIEGRLNTIFRAKFQQALKKTPDDPTAAADIAYAETLDQFDKFKKRDQDDPTGEYYKSPVGEVGANGTRVFFPNLSSFDAQAAQSRQQARNNVKLDVKNNGIQTAVDNVATKLKPQLFSLTRRYEANPSKFSYPVEVTELAEITGEKPSDILNMMLEAADIKTIPNFEPLRIIESDPQLVQSMNDLYRTNVITQRAGAYGSNTVSAFVPGGGGAVSSLIMQGEGNVNSVNRGMAGDTPGGSEEVFGRPFSQVSVEEILTAQMNGDVSAVGKYQIIPKTMLSWIKSGHSSAPKMNEMFTDSVQSKFWGYVTDVKRPAIGAYLNGETSDPTEAAQALSREFASVGIQYPEDGRTRGQSRYAGIGGNMATITPDQAIRALKQQRARNMGQTTRSSRQANGAGLRVFRKQVMAQPVLENSSGQPGLDIYFEDKQVPVVMSGRVKEHGFEKGYGNFTVIEAVDPDTGNLVDVLYSHLESPSNLLVGSRVDSGTIVGKQGGTGNVKSIDGTIASIDFLQRAEAGSKDMTPYAHHDRLRRRVSSNLGHPQ